MPIQDAKPSGDRLQFSMAQSIDGRSAPQRFEGCVNVDTISGSRIANAAASANGQQHWNAQRQPGTIAPLDVAGSNQVVSES